MKEVIAVEKHILSVEKRNALEERKYKKVTFRDDSKNKPPKDPFDFEGLWKVFKTMSHEMVDIRKQVAETSSKNPFIPFNRNSPANLKTPNYITNSKSDEDEVSPSEEQTDEEEVAELQGMWDFILLVEETQESLPVAT